MKSFWVMIGLEGQKGPFSYFLFQNLDIFCHFGLPGLVFLISFFKTKKHHFGF